MYSPPPTSLQLRWKGVQNASYPINDYHSEYSEYIITNLREYYDNCGGNVDRTRPACWIVIVNDSDPTVFVLERRKIDRPKLHGDGQETCAKHIQKTTISNGDLSTVTSQKKQT